MSDLLTRLLVLQDRAAKLLIAHRAVEEFPDEKEEMLTRLAARKKADLEHRTQALLIDAARKKLELESGSLEVQIAKFIAQRSMARKQAEYEALEHEIEASKAKISLMDDQQLALMDQFEAAMHSVAEEEKECIEVESKVRTAILALEERAAAAQQELPTLQAEVAAAKAALPAEVVTRFDHILRTKGDRAIVVVDHGKNCGGCHMVLGPRTLLAARSFEEAASCEHCGRFVYIP